MWRPHWRRFWTWKHRRDRWVGCSRKSSSRIETPGNRVQTMLPGRAMNRLVAVLLAAILVAPVVPAKSKKKPRPPADPSQGVNFYSLDRELALGRQMASEVERESRLIDDPAVAEYVNRLGQNIVRNSDATVPFTIKVIDSDDINAFALPGGFLFVNTGLVLRAANEAELAAVMAHEIAHVAARHGTRQASRAEIVNYASIPLIFLGGWAGYAVRQAAAL